MKRILLAAAGLVLLAAQAAVGQENTSGSQHVFYVDIATGHIHELLWTPSGGWANQDLTAITSAPTTFTQKGLASIHDSNGIEVFYETGGQIHELYWNPVTGWSHQLRVSGGALSGTPITAFVDSNGEYVFVVDSNGTLHQLKYKTSWSNTLLSSIPNSIQTLASYADGATTAHLFAGVGTSAGCCEGIWEIYYNGSSQTTTNLGGNALGGSGLSAFWDGNGQFIGFVPLDPTLTHVTNLQYKYWNPVNGSWTTQAPSGLYAPTGSPYLTGFTNGYGEHFFGISNDGSGPLLFESYFNTGTRTWNNTNLTALTGVIPRSGTELTSFSNGAFDEHVFVISGGASGNFLYELHYPQGGPWSASIILGTPFPDCVVALSSFVY